MNKNVLYLLIATGLGIVACFMAVQYINKQVAVRTPVDHTQTVSVVVAVHPMQKGEILTKEDISARDVPTDFVPADVVTPDTYGNFLGQVLRAPLAQGAPLSASAVDLVAASSDAIAEVARDLRERLRVRIPLRLHQGYVERMRHAVTVRAHNVGGG